MAAEAGWRRHTASRPWTPELIKLPHEMEHGEPVDMVAVCDISGTPQIAVRRETLLRAHCEKGEMRRLKLEQRREDLAVAEQLSSFGSSGGAGSNMSSPRSELLSSRCRTYHTLSYVITYIIRKDC